MLSLASMAFNWLLMKLFMTGVITSFNLFLIALEIKPLKTFKSAAVMPPEKVMSKLPMVIEELPEMTRGRPASTPKVKPARALVLLKVMETDPEPWGMLGQIYRNQHGQ